TSHHIVAAATDEDIALIAAGNRVIAAPAVERERETCRETVLRRDDIIATQGADRELVACQGADDFGSVRQPGDGRRAVEVGEPDRVRPGGTLRRQNEIGCYG